MTFPDTTFPKPEFALTPDSHARWYANVDNRITRYYRNGRSREATVQVPTALFTLMREVLKIDPVDEVKLYLTPQDEYFVFGLAWGTAETNVADLWYYTAGTLPPFLK